MTGLEGPAHEVPAAPAAPSLARPARGPDASATAPAPADRGQATAGTEKQHVKSGLATRWPVARETAFSHPQMGALPPPRRKRR